MVVTASQWFIRKIKESEPSIAAFIYKVVIILDLTLDRGPQIGSRCVKELTHVSAVL